VARGNRGPDVAHLLIRHFAGGKAGGGVLAQVTAEVTRPPAISRGGATAPVMASCRAPTWHGSAIRFGDPVRR